MSKGPPSSGSMKGEDALVGQLLMQDLYLPLPGDLVTRFQAASKEMKKWGWEQRVISVTSLKVAPRFVHMHLFPSKTHTSSRYLPLWPTQGLTRLMDALGLNSFELIVV